MRLLVGITALSLMTAPALGNLLTNPTWQAGDNTGWMQTDGGYVTDITPGHPGDAPGETDGFTWGQNGNYSSATGSNMQSVLPPELGVDNYGVNANVYLYLFDSGGVESSISAELLIDGVPQDIVTLSGAGLDTGWQQVDLSYTGAITTDAALDIAFNIDGTDGTVIDMGSPWAWAWADGATLTIIPEPSVIALLAIGSLPMLRRRKTSSLR